MNREIGNEEAGAMRTWKIQKLRDNGRAIVGPITDGVEVIELGPALDLLERLKNALELARFGPSADEPDRVPSLEAARSLLRTHGRLDG